MGRSLAQALRRAVRKAAQTLVWSFSSSGNSSGKGFQRNAAAEGSGKSSGNAGSGLGPDSLASYDGLSSLELDEGGFEGSSRCAGPRTDRLGRLSWGLNSRSAHPWWLAAPFPVHRVHDRQAVVTCCSLVCTSVPARACLASSPPLQVHSTRRHSPLHSHCVHIRF